MQILGLRRFLPFLDFQIGIPLFEHCGPFLVQRLHPGLKEQMRAPFRPLHLLLFAEAFVHHLIHG